MITVENITIFVTKTVNDSIANGDSPSVAYARASSTLERLLYWALSGDESVIKFVEDKIKGEILK